MEKISLTQIGLHNPRRQNSELTEKLFVIRQKQFEMLMEAIAEEEKSSIPQHHIIIAQRGMGKTTLLNRIAIELHKPKYKNRFVPLSFPEELYTVNCLGGFWLECLKALVRLLKEEQYNETEVELVNKQKNEFSLHDDLEKITMQIYQFLMKTCRTLKRRPVLLVDNIGILFQNLSKNNQHSLRALLSENGAPIVLGTGVIALPSQDNRFPDSFPYIMNYDEPFYDYFQLHYLKKLTYEDFEELLIKLSDVTESNIPVFNEKARLRSLHLLTGGNPRTAVMLFKLIAKGFAKEIKDDLEALLDQTTPLYKARYEELSDQSRRVIAFIALNWEPISLKKLSQKSGYANNQLSPQLKRLTEEGWIETTPSEKTKGNAYFISERFFNIWFLMRQEENDDVILLSKFLEYFYGSDLEKVVRNHLSKGYQCEKDYVFGLALENSKMVGRKTRNEIVHKMLSSNIDVIENEDLKNEINNKKTKRWIDAFDKGYEHGKKGNFDKAIECYQKTIELKPDDADAYYNMGVTYNDKGNYDKAIEYYQKSIELKPDDMAYNNMGVAYAQKGNYDEAIECYKKAIELKPDDKAYYNMGNAYAQKGNYDEAIEYYQKSIELKPDKYEAYNNMGIAYDEKGNYDKAIECYKKAIELNNNLVYPKNNLKNLYRENLVKISKEQLNAIKEWLEKDERLLQEALFELHNRNEGIAKGLLLEALQSIKDELPKETMENWYYFAAISLNLNYSNWFLDILKDKGFDKILSPYFVAVQALEKEQKESKEKAEIYLKNRAVEISEPARMIIEKIRKYMD